MKKKTQTKHHHAQRNTIQGAPKIRFWLVLLSSFHCPPLSIRLPPTRRFSPSRFSSAAAAVPQRSLGCATRGRALLSCLRFAGNQHTHLAESVSPEFTSSLASAKNNIKAINIRKIITTPFLSCIHAAFTRHL